jgi:hypothetical protein
VNATSISANEGTKNIPLMITATSSADNIVSTTRSINRSIELGLGRLPKAPSSLSHGLRVTSHMSQIKDEEIKMYRDDTEHAVARLEGDCEWETSRLSKNEACHCS